MPQAISKPQLTLNDAVEKVRNVAPSDFGELFEYASLRRMDFNFDNELENPDNYDYKVMRNETKVELTIYYNSRPDSYSKTSFVRQNTSSANPFNHNIYESEYKTATFSLTKVEEEVVDIDQYINQVNFDNSEILNRHPNSVNDLSSIHSVFGSGKDHFKDMVIYLWASHLCAIYEGYNLIKLHLDKFKDFGWKKDISPSKDLDKALFDKGEKAVFNSLEKVVFEKEQNFHKYCDMIEEKIRKSKRKLGI